MAAKDRPEIAPSHFGAPGKHGHDIEDICQSLAVGPCVTAGLVFPTIFLHPELAVAQKHGDQNGTKMANGTEDKNLRNRLKKTGTKINPGEWKHGPKPAVCPSSLTLSQHPELSTLRHRHSGSARPCPAGDSAPDGVQNRCEARPRRLWWWLRLRGFEHQNAGGGGWPGGGGGAL